MVLEVQEHQLSSGGGLLAISQHGGWHDSRSRGGRERSQGEKETRNSEARLALFVTPPKNSLTAQDQYLSLPG